MPYKILIVDDEEIMRDGLANLIDWKSMGFEIVDKLEDGQDTIDYIKEKSVDVILTDIKMTFVSGLDVARYVFENNLPTKVILISGYKEFEFAQNAIRYNVVHYLLKPVMLKDVYDVFVQMKDQLDKERELKRQKALKNNQIDELMMISRRQFFIDAVLGAFDKEEEITDRIRLLGLKEGIQNNPCAILVINIQDIEKFSENDWGYNKEGLYNAVRNFFGDGKFIQYFDIGIQTKEMRFLGIQIDGYKHDFEQELKRQIEEIKTGAKTLLGLNVTIHVRNTYKNIIEMALSTDTRDSKYDVKGIQHDNSIDVVKLQEQQKLIYTHILNGEPDVAASILRRHFEWLGRYGNIVLKKSVFDFFALLYSKLVENGINLQMNRESLLAESKIVNCKSAIEIIEQVENLFSQLIKHIEGQIGNSGKGVIIRIKQYIIENYSKDITLEEVAEHVFLSPVYLSRMFKEKTGENFSDYVVKVKIEKAMELLKNPKNRVYDVGTMVGYSNTKYFYKLFKRYVGCTPTEYRNSI